MRRGYYKFNLSGSSVITIDLVILFIQLRFSICNLFQSLVTVARSDSDRKSWSSESDGAEVVYSKENVTIHPSQYASERISGRLRLIMQGSSLFMVLIVKHWML